MARRVLKANVSRGPEMGRPRLRLDGWREDGLWQQIDDGGGIATMGER